MGDIILKAILHVVAIILFYIEKLLCNILDLVYGMFEVFSGIKTVSYNGQDAFLSNVFFDEPVINTAFWGMALIGLVLTFVFAIISVIRKTFDSNDKHKLSYGTILTNILKSGLIILLMSTIINVTLFSSNIFMQQIDALFDMAEKSTEPEEITFNDEDYATMFRILNTIAAHTMNPSYDNTYNINSCFNDIRPDLQILSKKNFFKFTYEIPETADNIGTVKNSWQKAIRNIGVAADLSQDLMLDEYNASVNQAIVNCSELLRKDASFKPLSEYKEARTKITGAALGRTLMVASTFSAANNGKYNRSASLTDELRRPYYTGEKNIYDLDEFEEDFSVDLDSFNHIVALLGTAWLIKEFLIILLNCVSRIFNMLVLYLVAPPFIATMPLDDGGKFKQWTTAFIIQAFGIFGTFIAVRLVILFIPIVLNPELILFENKMMDIIGKLLIILGITFTSGRASGMISGILADNAGMQSIMAGDAGSAAVGALSNVGMKAAGMAVGAAATATTTVGGATLKGLANVSGATHLGNRISSAAGNAVQSMKDNFGIVGAVRSGFATDKSRSAAAEKARQDKQNAAYDKILNGGTESRGEKKAGENGAGGSGAGSGSSFQNIAENFKDSPASRPRSNSAGSRRQAPPLGRPEKK